MLAGSDEQAPPPQTDTQTSQEPSEQRMDASGTHTHTRSPPSHARTSARETNSLTHNIVHVLYILQRTRLILVLLLAPLQTSRRMELRPHPLISRRPHLPLARRGQSQGRRGRSQGRRGRSQGRRGRGQGRRGRVVRRRRRGNSRKPRSLRSRQ